MILHTQMNNGIFRGLEFSDPLFLLQKEGGGSVNTNITFNQFLQAIGVIGAVIGFFVSALALLSRRDNKTVQTAKMETILEEIKKGLTDLRIEVKAGLKELDTRLSRLEADVSQLKAVQEMQEKSISRAHQRIDDIGKG